MNEEQQRESTLRWAVTVSSLPTVASADRQRAFEILQQFHNYPGRVAIVLPWLQQNTPIQYEQHDISTAARLLALEVISDFLVKGYAQLADADRLQLRHAILTSCRNTALQQSNVQTRILSRKLAMILEELVIRDFPQRWATFAPDVLAPAVAGGTGGGLWFDNPGEQAVGQLGVRICLECFKLVAEDCTDSDFNSKISVSRRNDVLTGLNEIAGRRFLPQLFQLLEHYPILQQAKTTLNNMHGYLINQKRTTATLTDDEKRQYQSQVEVRDQTADLLSAALVTLSKFATSMPLNWLVDGQHDFVAAFLHLLREPHGDVQVRALECLDFLVLRGKLSESQWLRLVRDVPSAIHEANQQLSVVEHQMIVAARTAQSGGSPPAVPDALTLQLEFHRGVSRLLANLIASHISHVTSNKSILSCNGDVFDQFTTLLHLLVELLQHPSGRVCMEQINTWIVMLRDPQLSSTQLFKSYTSDVLSAYMHHMMRIRWDDVIGELHPHAKLLETSFDDEDEYNSWQADLRSRSSHLYKLLGSVDPVSVAESLMRRVSTALAAHGKGEPRDHLDTSNRQLTPQSDAVLIFEALAQPLEYCLHGIPLWTLNRSAAIPKGVVRGAEARLTVSSTLNSLALAIVSWDPVDLWMRFRRAVLLESLASYWAKCRQDEASQSLQGAVESLLKYLALPDEWVNASNDRKRLSDETTGLKKKSGVSLVAIAKEVPEQLVPWLPQLGEATKAILSAEGTIPRNQMHLYEFLSCVAAAVDDPLTRSNFIKDVLGHALEVLESPEVQEAISSADALLDFFGVTQASQAPSSVDNQENVRRVKGNYAKLFTALNRLLAVGRRCNESARKKSVVGGVAFDKMSTSFHIPPFPDEGPLSINELAITDPFVPLWPRLLPILLQLYESTLSIWRPSVQARLLSNSYQRYVFAISDDEAFFAQNHNATSGGVFGEGGTAGSVVQGIDRRDDNLVPKWSGWFNEMRNCCFQLLGMLATSRALFAPEIAPIYPRLVTVVANQENLLSMEHRHFSQFVKHVVELFTISCPSTLYATYLAPLLGPVFDHVHYRLDRTWAPLLRPVTWENITLSAPAKALTSGEAAAAAKLAAKGGEPWYNWYMGHGGAFVGDLDPVASEAVVEKYRVDCGRSYCDFLQTAFALKGDWALVLANLSRAQHSARGSNGSGDPGGFVISMNADGTAKEAFQNAADARKLLRINALCRHMLLENDQIASALVSTCIQCLEYPDAYTCRRITKICHRILETVAWVPQYSSTLGQAMYTAVVKSIVTEPKWMVGVEWDMINVARDIYCRLVLGQTLQFGGQGSGQAQNNVGGGDHQFEQAKSFEEPLEGGGILTISSSMPRDVLLSLPGVSQDAVDQFDREMRLQRSAKTQKDLIRDLLRVGADRLKEIMPPNQTTSYSGLLDRAVEEESLLHSKSRPLAVPALPEKLVTHSQVSKMQRKSFQDDNNEPQGLAAFQL